MGKKLQNNGPEKVPKKKRMSSQLLFRNSPFNYGLGSVQPWEVWKTYEDACRALKKMSPGRAREKAKRKAKAALILGLWEIDRIEENGRLEEEAERKRVLTLRDNKKQADYEHPMDNKKDAEPAPQGNLEAGPDLEGFE